MTAPAPPTSVREIHPSDEDAYAYVMATWIEASRGSGVARRMPYSEHRRVHVPLLRQVAARSTMLVASPDGEPGVFCGFVVGEPERRLLHYLYTKAVYRELGIASQLLQSFALRILERAPRSTRGDAPRMTHLPVESLPAPVQKRLREWLGRMGYVYCPHQLWLPSEERPHARV